jgi:signal transduction histidine kinase
VERAAYFVISEALSNVYKHAAATRATVAVCAHDGRLVVDVGDDGVGGANAGGTGLRGLDDRIGALRGTLRVDSPVSVGTRIVAELPCRAPASNED